MSESVFSANRTSDGRTPSSHYTAFSRIGFWAIVAGLLFVLIAFLGDAFPQSHPGFGRVQLHSLVIGGILLIMGSFLLSRIPVAERRRGILVVAKSAGIISLKCALLIFMLILTILAVEVWARLRAHRPLGPTPPKKRLLYLLADLPERDQFLSDLKAVRSAGGKYHNYSLYSVRPIATDTINFTDFYAARHCPASIPPPDSDEIIWLFGGSTMLNLETTDELTLANQVGKYLQDSGISATVKNFGVGSFQSSLELAKFQELLRQVPATQVPTVVVFYDGYNDPGHGYMFGAGNIQGDLAIKLRLLIEGYHAPTMRYAVAQSLGTYSVFCRDYICPHITPPVICSGCINDASHGNLEKTVSIYVDNTKMIRAICREFGILPLFVLQPVPHTKKGRTEFEDEFYCTLPKDRRMFIQDFYRCVQETIADKDDFLDLSSLFDFNGRNDFYDHAHTGPYSGKDTGRAIGKRILKMIQERDETS